MMNFYIKVLVLLFSFIAHHHSVEGTDLYSALDDSSYEIKHSVSRKKLIPAFHVQKTTETTYIRKIEALEEWSIYAGQKVGAIGGGLLGLGFAGITLGLGVVVFPGFWYGGKAFGGYMGYQFSKKHGLSFINYIYGYDWMGP